MTEVQELFIEAMKVIKSLSHACGSMAQVIGTLARDARIDLLHQTQPTLNDVSSALEERDQFFKKSLQLFERMIAERDAENQPKLWTVYLNESSAALLERRKAYESNDEGSAREHYDLLANTLSSDNWRGRISLVRPDQHLEWSENLPRIENVPCGGPKQ